MKFSLTVAAVCLFTSFGLAESIRIDSVDKKYGIQSFSFEVNPENGRAGIRLVYDNPQELTGLEDTGDQGPLPRITTLRNLKYDPSGRAVVYQESGKTVTCATEAKHWTVFGKASYMKPTGACRVSSRLTDHTLDNGWSIEHRRTLDTYLEIAAK